MLGSEVYVGGDFATVGGGAVPAKGIARWDGAQWQPMSGVHDTHFSANNISGWVYELTAADGQLYTGGQFDRASDVEAHNVAVWDGAGWSALGGNAEFFDYYIQDGLPKEAMTATYALALDGDTLYIGGYFVRLKTGPTLDDQTPVRAVEIYDVPVKRLLPPELEPVQPALAQALPQPPLGGRAHPPQLPRPLGGIGIAHWQLSSGASYRSLHVATT